MVVNMRVHGITTKDTAEALNDIQKDTHIVASLYKVRQKEKVFTLGQMVRSMMARGTKV